MTRRLAVIAAVERTRTEYVHVRPWIFATILLVGGIPALGIGVLGWLRARSIVPTSLAETEYWKRYRVIRRGSVAFAIVGVACLALAGYALTVHGYHRTVRYKTTH